MKKSLLDGKVFNFFLSVWMTLLIAGGLLLVYKANYLFVPMTAEQFAAQARLISLGKAQVYMDVLLLVMRHIRIYLRSPD